jgi:1-acyl-sn-glycerol-3-phosphate acyltransferase
VNRPRLDLWYRLGRLLARIFLPTFGSLTVEGRENVPSSGPIIIAANHQSEMDPAVMVYAIDRPVWFMAKRGLFAGPIASYFLRSVHVFPVDRDGRDFDALHWAQDRLDDGSALLVFPEGTRSPGHLSEPVDGLAYIALRTGVPVLPVAITGTEHIPMIRIPFHFRKMKVVIGEPFSFPPRTSRTDRTLLHSMSEEVMKHIAELLPPAYRGVYAEPRHEPSLTEGEPDSGDE